MMDEFFSAMLERIKNNPAQNVNSTEFKKLHVRSEQPLYTSVAVFITFIVFT